MGEAPAVFADDFQGKFSNGLLLKSKGCETVINLGCSKTYAIGGTENESACSVGIRIFDKSTSEWVIPIVLGTKPKLSNGHSAIALDDDRILVIKGNSNSDDCFWFLEVNTAFVREQRIRLGTEVVAWSKGVVGETKIPVVISGPSGVGKGTLISKLMEDFPEMFGFSVSHTTRAPRNNEQNGVHYHFTERSVMEKDIQDGKFLEFASVHGNLYGTSIEAVEVVTDQGKALTCDISGAVIMLLQSMSVRGGREFATDVLANILANKNKRCILDIDVQGARSVRASSLEAIFVFICPPSFEELEKRLRARGTETEEQIQKRLRNAKAEIDQGTSPGLFDHILVNDDLQTCYENLKRILGLSNGVKTTNTCMPELIHVPLEHTVSKIDQKILINCSSPEQEKSAPNMLVLDISSIKGGAPGRTRGLNIYTAEPLTDGFIGFKIPS